jgi:hypothetical protein
MSKYAVFFEKSNTGYGAGARRDSDLIRLMDERLVDWPSI